MELGIGAVIGLLFGGLLAWLVLRTRTASLQARLALMDKELAATKADLARLLQDQRQLVESRARMESALESEKKASTEKIELLTRAGEDLQNAFKALAADALKSNNSSFLQIAQETLKRFQSEAKGDLDARQKAVSDLVTPVRESLSKVDAQIQQMEIARGEAYGDLKAQVQSLITTQRELQSETGNLVRALRTPNVRGRWGEIQLRRVVEIAGMLPYCDFAEQETVTTEAGRFRPDLVIKLPGGKNVVVDAKTPLQAFLEAFETNDEETRRACLANHARQVRDHINTLSGKKYWEQFESTPEFVVMFLPGETFFSAALEQDTGLIEHGVLNRVIPASPTTLIALLKAINYGWNQEKLARNAQQISALGKELHERLRKLAGHITGVGANLDRAVEAYNQAVGSLENRVLVSARKFAELGAAVAEDIPELEPIETTARALSFEWDEEPPESDDRKAG
ncbi:MAG TPA: DNA recombination protein RmuC [Candidatus Sulfotelmatobacter sp.]|jgi:DNA recombination protein RmuC|nr:DNA recombination protein RmuC [Candidatus Sulfotelmatobacter sp.]